MAPHDPGAPPLDADPVSLLAERTGFGFPDRALALAALTHKSYVNEHRDEGLSDNERLEFLGDAVLDLAVSQLLMDRFPRAREGDLSKIRAALVDEPALAAQGRAMGLGPLLRLGRGEVLTGGRDKASLLADALEAVIAVIYLGGGIEPVLRFLSGALAASFESASAGTLDRDYKTQLQEAAQSRLRATPRYRVVAQSGPDHQKVFEVELELRGEILGRGTGRSKKDAEQVAARQGLEALAVRAPDGSGAPAPALVPQPAITPLLDAIAAVTPAEAAAALCTPGPDAEAAPEAAPPAPEPAQGAGEAPPPREEGPSHAEEAPRPEQEAPAGKKQEAPTRKKPRARRKAVPARKAAAARRARKPAPRARKGRG